METNPIDAYLKDYMQHLIWVGLSLVVWMLIKDMLAKLAAGITFYASPNWSVGDECLIDNKRAIISSIGIRTTVFQIRQNGEVRWRFVPNDKITELTLEKVVDMHNIENHLKRDVGSGHNKKTE
tara:strand:- start:57057 stop:57428 length:372 start_codon:yes stop_codon:yes gene_type:complete